MDGFEVAGCGHLILATGYVRCALRCEMIRVNKCSFCTRISDWNSHQRIAHLRRYIFWKKSGFCRWKSVFRSFSTVYSVWDADTLNDFVQWAIAQSMSINRIVFSFLHPRNYFLIVHPRRSMIPIYSIEWNKWYSLTFKSLFAVVEGMHGC